MKRQYLVIMGLLALLGILTVIGFQTGFLATVYDTDGSAYTCGEFYSSYFTDFSAVTPKCGNYDYFCAIETRTGSLGTIYDWQCYKYCVYCTGSQQGYLRLEAGRDACKSADWSLTLQDAKAFDASPTNTNADKYVKNYCPTILPSVTCYQCDGATLRTRTFSGSCGTGWTLTKPNCVAPPPSLVTCYQCQDYQLKSQQFESVCASGWSLSQPNCDMPSITCYSCSNNQMITQQVVGTSCGLLSATPVECFNDVYCYQCTTKGLETVKESGQCKEGFTEYNPDEQTPKCSTVTTLSKYIDFKEKPVQSSVLLVSILLLLISIFYTVKDLTNKNNSGF